MRLGRWGILFWGVFVVPYNHVVVGECRSIIDVDLICPVRLDLCMHSTNL